MTRFQKICYILSALILGISLTSSRGVHAEEPSQTSLPKTPIQHLIVLMQENHTFDNYFGTYPGVDGIPSGVCMPVNPSDPNTTCVEPYHIGERPISDLDHSESTFKLQFGSGRMDGFVYALNQRNQDGTATMGYYDGSDLPYYWNLADEYVLFDHFFSSDHSGSPQNHMYWVAGVAGKISTPSNGYGDEILTIFDRLEESGVSWKFYVQNYDPGITYRTLTEVNGNRASQVIWVPLLNFNRFIDNPKYASHIVDLNEYYADLEDGTLPAVAYIAPSGASEHPPGSLRSGQKFVKSLIQALMRSDSWNSSAFLLVYDDWGGWYDHVVPPQVDKNGYGFRVPALLVSAYARRGHVDSTLLDFTSILKFIEDNWNLAPLASRDAQAKSFITAFDFSQPVRQPNFIPFARVVKDPTAAPRRVVIYTAYGSALIFAAMAFTWIAIRGKGSGKPLASFDPLQQHEESTP
jgi:phospholipase C